jgi:hypothetical protein
MIWNKKNHGLLILAWMYKKHKKNQFQINYIKNYKKHNKIYILFILNIHEKLFENILDIRLIIYNYLESSC